jgi:glucokinase
MESLDLFVSIYGSAARNLALQVMAIGGMYRRRNSSQDHLEAKRRGVYEAFTDKGRFSKMLAKVPVKVIMNDRAAYWVRLPFGRSPEGS